MSLENIKTLSFGCRLNSLEAEKIKTMLAQIMDCAIVVNSCAVTAEAQRQSAQAVRRLARENPNAPIFVTGCAATAAPALFDNINNVISIANPDKLNPAAYLRGIELSPCHSSDLNIANFRYKNAKMSKQFIQVQNGCNHACTYCITRLLRGKSVSFPYDAILKDAKAAVAQGFYETVLTGVDIASYAGMENGSVLLLSDLCKNLLRDVPEIQRLRLSSMDPASPDIRKIIDLMNRDSRMMSHMHLSMQSGSDTILSAMLRRHNAEMVRDFVMGSSGVSFSWDIICGFPGETPELFQETCDLARQLKPIKIHAFPFSPRDGTAAANMPNHVDRAESKKRVKIISDIADENRREFMASKIGTTTSVLVESDNIARTPDDIPVKITGEKVHDREIRTVLLYDTQSDFFIGKCV